MLTCGCACRGRSIRDHADLWQQQSDVRLLQPEGSQRCSATIYPHQLGESPGTDERAGEGRGQVGHAHAQFNMKYYRERCRFRGQCTLSFKVSASHHQGAAAAPCWPQKYITYPTLLKQFCFTWFYLILFECKYHKVPCAVSRGRQSTLNLSLWVCRFHLWPLLLPAGGRGRSRRQEVFLRESRGHHRRLLPGRFTFPHQTAAKISRSPFGWLILRKNKTFYLESVSL